MPDPFIQVTAFFAATGLLDMCHLQQLWESRQNIMAYGFQVIWIYININIWIYLILYFFPHLPGEGGLLDFIRAVLLRLRILLLHLLRLLLLLAVRSQPRLPDRSGHCRTSTASSRSQWALPDLNRELQIPVGTAGPQPRLPDRSGHCRTTTATSRSQWALPDLNGKNVRKDVR